MLIITCASFSLISCSCSFSIDLTNNHCCDQVRPLLNKEKIEKDVECVTVDTSINQVNVGNSRGYRFDYAFDKNVKQVS